MNGYLHHLSYITHYLLDQPQPIPTEVYLKKVECLREATSSDPSDLTPAMVKTKALDSELAEIGRQRFNFPWCTEYSPKQHHQGLYILIHRDPNDCRPHRLCTTLIFRIKANMHNNQLGRFAMRKAEYLEGLFQ